MADPPRDPGSKSHTTPRWVKAFWIIAVVLAVLLVLMLTGVFGGGHGPGRHTPPGGHGAHTPLESRHG